MKQKPEVLPDSLLIAIFILLILGWGFLYLGRIATSYLSSNTYVGLIIATIIILPLIWLFYDLVRIFPRRGISEIFGLTMGKPLGKIMSVINVLYIFFLSIFGNRYAQLMVHTYFFTDTPFFLVTALFMILGLYLALKGVQAVGRLAAFMLLPPLLIIIFLILLGLNNVNSLNLQPILTGSPNEWFQAGLSTVFILLPLILIGSYLPYIRQPQSIKKIGLYSLSIIVPIFLLAQLGAIGVFGGSLIPKFSWPIVEFFHVIDYPYLLLEQAGLFFLIAWYSFVFVGVSQALYIIGNELHTILPRVKRNWFIIVISTLLLLGVNVPLNIVALQSFLLKHNSIITFSYLSLYVATWLVARLRFGRTKKIDLK